LKERQFDLLLLDVMMPIRDGMDVLAFCRNQEADATIRTPIIMVTAHAMSGDAEKFLEAGADGYLPKPVGMDNLAQEMTRVMQAHADRSA
ncbi:MAG: Autoinducer 2 sensor kinase/phosphatase LuxQ, partial [Pseudomonadota bacterium]